MSDTTPRFVQAGPIELDVQRMRLPNNLDAGHGPLLDLAFETLEQVEAGETVNVDEGWQVGHYWLRNPDLAPAEYIQKIRQSWEKIDEFYETGFTGRFDRILWIGIGGSGLGPQMVHDALRVPGETPQIFFFDNTDPGGMQRTLDEIGHAGGLERTLTVVVSKSGGTQETHNGMLVARRAYGDAGQSFESSAVAVTKPGSRLDQLAAEKSWLARFPIWDWVGGRTSLFSSVGRLPARLLGFDVDSLVAGAAAVDEATRTRPLDENAALLLAATWYHAVNSQGLGNMVVLPYCDRMVLLPKYLQQLVMESLGKDGNGITVLGNKGSTDQHSYVQQLRDGRPDFFATFVSCLKPGADWVVAPEAGGVPANAAANEVTVGDYLASFLEGTSRALADAGRISLRLTLDEVNAYTIGALVALYERAVGYYAAMVGINAYHQPGVEAGKRAATQFIDLQAKLIELLQSRVGTTVSVAPLAKEAKASADDVFQVLRRLAANGRFGLLHETADELLRVAEHRFKLVG